VSTLEARAIKVHEESQHKGAFRDSEQSQHTNNTQHTTHNTQQDKEQTKEKKRIEQANTKEKPCVDIGGRGN